MPTPTLVLHVAIALANEARLASARTLAERLGARVIAVAAADPRPPAALEGAYPPEVVVSDRRYAQERMAAAEAEFRAAFEGRADRIEWRSAFAAPGAYLAAQARAADLVISGAIGPELLSDPNWRLDPGDLVMRAGRPVLIVPEAGAPIGPGTVVLGWKNNRESRRAAADLLPLGRLADRVLVVSITEDGDETDAQAAADDVVAWFGLHGVRAESRLQRPDGHPATQLRRLAADEGADLIAAGAYGYSRTREWMLGGVTRDFLTRGAPQHVLLTH